MITRANNPAPREPVRINTLGDADYWRLVQSPLVKIIVGKDITTEYTIPRDLIGFYSPYFTARFRPKGFKEGCEGVLRLEDEDPKHVKLPLRYIRIDGLKRATTCELVDDYNRWGAECVFDGAVNFIKFCERYDVVQAFEACGHVLEPYAPHFWTYCDGRFLLDYSDAIIFMFERPHYCNPCLKPVTNMLARMMVEKNLDCDDAAQVQNFLSWPGNTTVAGHVMQEMPPIPYSTGKSVRLPKEVKPKSNFGLNANKCLSDLDESEDSDDDSDEEEDDEGEAANAEAMQT